MELVAGTELETSLLVTVSCGSRNLLVRKLEVTEEFYAQSNECLTHSFGASQRSMPFPHIAVEATVSLYGGAWSESI